MARKREQSSVLPLWFVLGLVVLLFLLIRAFYLGRVTLSGVEEFAVINGTLALLIINLVLCGLALQSGRRAAWWPTLVTLAGLGLWGWTAWGSAWPLG